MGKKEEKSEHHHKTHRDKSRKKHKHHHKSSSSSSKHKKSEKLESKTIKTTAPEEIATAQIVEEDIIVDENFSQEMAMNESSSLVYDEENVDIEVEEVTLDCSMEETKIEEETGQVIEKVEKVKKTNKKPDNAPQTPTNKPSTSASAAGVNAKKSKKRRESGTSSEEERWLTAIESGKLEEVEDVELRKIKDPKLMTARQRAMYDRNNDVESAPGFTETLIALPTGYKEKEKPQTAEEIQKAALKTLKRKQQADEKREKDKKKTMERLLKKQESKNRSSAKPKNVKEATPVISYKNTAEGGFIHLPVGVDFPLKPQQPKEPPPRQLCGMPGCGQPKVYNCSKTNIPLCSFACYRKNVQSLKEIMC
ncbi:INO80 complex subunit B [Musca domestica]|uniref:INO80 complex subunit B n=1 Tax=Musca domestica TaxID=7370 RepID=A0A1I8M3A4_MUSDO|nr:INO80 complex subunit B [Musca domestica]